MIRRFMEFRKKTHEQYNNDHREHMETWKSRVMSLHEHSGFLFYYETFEFEKPDGSELIISGELAKDESLKKFYHKGTSGPASVSPGTEEKTKAGGKPQKALLRLYLYDGQGRLLGEGVALSDPSEKEEKRRGFLSLRKQQMKIRLTRLYGEGFPTGDKSKDNRRIDLLYGNLSLISDMDMRKISF